MNECHLDWKKVFKDILGKGHSSHDGTKSEQYNSEPNSQVTNSETKNSIENYSSLELKSGSTSERHEYKVNYMNINRRHECKVKQSSCQKTLKLFPGKTSNVTYIKSYSHIEQTCSSPDVINRSVEVPEWNQVFKNILQNSPTKDAQEQKTIDLPLKKKSISSQKHYIPAHRKRSSWKKQQSTVLKYEMEAEVKEVREMFARSRLFTYDSSFDNLNDLAGSGVDIFKSGKTLTSIYGKKTESKVKSEDNFSDEYVKPDFPVTAFTAKIKQITMADVLNSPDFEITEWWDDDLLF